MNIVNHEHEIEEMRINILALIRHLTVELSRRNGNAILYRSDLLSILTEEERLLLQDRPDLDRLKLDNSGIFRTVTDDDFQHTPLGKRFLDLTERMAIFIRKSSELESSKVFLSVDVSS